VAAPRFDGKVVLITGAAGGIGRAAAVEKAGGAGLTVEADVTRAADVAR